MNMQILLGLVQIILIGILVYILFPLIRTLKEANKSQKLPFNMAMKQVENIDHILKINEKKYSQKIEELKNDYEKKIRELQISQSEKNKTIDIYSKNIKAIEIATNWELGRTAKSISLDFQITLMVLIQEILYKSKEDKEHIIEKIKKSSPQELFNAASEEALLIYKDLANYINLKNTPVMPFSEYKDYYK